MQQLLPHPLDVQKLKSFRLQGGFAPLTPWPGALVRPCSKLDFWIHYHVLYKLIVCRRVQGMFTLFFTSAEIGCVSTAGSVWLVTRQLWVVHGKLFGCHTSSLCRLLRHRYTASRCKRNRRCLRWGRLAVGKSDSWGNFTQDIYLLYFFASMYDLIAAYELVVYNKRE